jgi:hypothetical protein
MTVKRGGIFAIIIIFFGGFISEEVEGDGKRWEKKKKKHKYFSLCNQR